MLCYQFSLSAEPLLQLLPELLGLWLRFLVRRFLLNLHSALLLLLLDDDHVGPGAIAAMRGGTAFVVVVGFALSHSGETATAMHRSIKNQLCFLLVVFSLSSTVQFARKPFVLKGCPHGTILRTNNGKEQCSALRIITNCTVLFLTGLKIWRLSVLG